MASRLGALECFSESSFPTTVSPNLIACSPTIDLSATASDDGVLFIRRSKGEQVSKHIERGKQVLAVRWKADGTFPRGI